MGLSAEIVDFVGLELVEQLYHLHGIGEVAVVEMELHAVNVRVAVKVIDPARVEGRGPANHAVNFVAFGEQELGEIRTVLSGDTGDESFLHEARERERANEGRQARSRREPSGRGNTERFWRPRRRSLVFPRRAVGRILRKTTVFTSGYSGLPRSRHLGH